jgi:ABC-type phosphate/phosphonate transport system substrate-binding protein
VIAALPMYERAETRAATDRLWSAIAARLRDAGLDAPAALTRAADAWELWQSPDLLLAQTCGLPFRAHLHRRVALVGTPDYGLPGCPPGYYRSVIVVRAAGAAPGRVPEAPRLAFNDPLSQSGWAAALDWASARGLHFSALVETGAHAASAAAVAEGRADIAAIDAVTWRLLRRYDPAASGLRELARTAPVPGLPLITARGRDAPALAQAVAGAVAGLDGADRAALGLFGLVRIPTGAYLALPIPPNPAAVAAESGVSPG